MSELSLPAAPAAQSPFGDLPADAAPCAAAKPFCPAGAKRLPRGFATGRVR